MNDHPESARRFFDSDDVARWGRGEMSEQDETTRAWIERANVQGRSIELGCGMESLAPAARSYAGVDLAFVPLRQLHRRGVQAYMEKLPFRDGTFDFLFT